MALISDMACFSSAGYSRITLTTYVVVLVVSVSMIVVHWMLRNSSLEAAMAKLPWYGRSCLLAVMLYLIAISMGGQDRAFIYFQF